MHQGDQLSPQHHIDIPCYRGQRLADCLEKRAYAVSHWRNILCVSRSRVDLPRSTPTTKYEHITTCAIFLATNMEKRPEGQQSRG